MDKKQKTFKINIKAQIATDKSKETNVDENSHINPIDANRNLDFLCKNSAKVIHSFYSIAIPLAKLKNKFYSNFSNFNILAKLNSNFFIFNILAKDNINCSNFNFSSSLATDLLRFYLFNSRLNFIFCNFLIVLKFTYNSFFNYNFNYYFILTNCSIFNNYLILANYSIFNNYSILKKEIIKVFFVNEGYCNLNFQYSNKNNNFLI